jgi:transcriptional regulator with XRE-family HTH domain
LIKTDKAEVAKNIKSFLQFARKRGYCFSQPDIAKETGITRCQLSNYETGKTIPSLLAAIALADMFDISLDYLVGRCDNSQAHKTMKVWKFKEDNDYDGK